MGQFYAGVDNRELLFGTGAGDREQGVVLDREALAKVLKDGGHLPLATVLRCRVRYFNDGAVLGSKAYVATQLAAYRRQTGRRLHSEPRPLPPLTDWGGLTVMRGLRGHGFG